MNHINRPEVLSMDSKGVVGARGFEPPTSCSQSRRATGLRYAPTELEGSTGCSYDLSFCIPELY